MRLEQYNLGQINERSSFTVSLSTLDANGSASLPSTLEWRLVCLETDTVLQDWTSVTLTETTDTFGNLIAATADIEVDGSLHAMQTSNMASERKALCVAADRGSGEYNSEAQYVVVRLGARS